MQCLGVGLGLLHLHVALLDHTLQLGAQTVDLIVGVDEFELHALELHARAVRTGGRAIRHLFEIENARLQLVNGDGPLKHFVFQTVRESVCVKRQTSIRISDCRMRFKIRHVRRGACVHEIVASNHDESVSTMLRMLYLVTGSTSAGAAAVADGGRLELRLGAAGAGAGAGADAAAGGAAVADAVAASSFAGLLISSD
jgi:hypothetical protein